MINVSAPIALETTKGVGQAAPSNRASCRLQVSNQASKLTIEDTKALSPPPVIDNVPEPVHGGEIAGESPGEIYEDIVVFNAALLQATAGWTRLIGIDAGTKTLGLALSDVERIIASPLETLKRRKFKLDLEALKGLIQAHKVCGLVLGLPTNLDGTEGPRAQSARALARNLAAALPMPILLWDERLTTAQAERVLIEADASRRRRGEVIDKLAATLILQSSLDRMRMIPAP